MQTEGQLRHALPPGTVLNGVYRVEAELGQGGFGIVYRAHHTELDYPVAIKEYLPAELAIREGRSVHPRSADCREHFQEGMRRFLEEAKQLIAFRNHPNIVSCRDFFRANGTAYLVMEYEEGLPLSELLRAREKEGRPFGEEDLRKVMVPLLEGLRQVHEAGVLHRDIKPGNILVRRKDERPVLIDFGAAKQNFAERSKSLAPFTEGYAAIEQVGEGKLGPWTDLYAVGAVMWRMVAGGNPPFEPPNPVKVESRTHAVLRGEADPMPSARELGRGRFSERVLGAIDQCLELREGDRVQGCAELLGLLRTDEKTVPAAAEPRPAEEVKFQPPREAEATPSQAAMRRIWVPQFIVSLMLLWALNPDNPYGYYILLRIACCAVFAYLARKAFHLERQGWVWILGIMAVVYNPIIPVHLTREIWALVNVLTIGIAVASIFAIRVKDEKRDAGKRKFTAADGSVWEGPVVDGRKQGHRLGKIAIKAVEVVIKVAKVLTSAAAVGLVAVGPVVMYGKEPLPDWAFVTGFFGILLIVVVAVVAASVKGFRLSFLRSWKWIAAPPALAMLAAAAFLTLQYRDRPRFTVEQACAGQPEGAECWKELANQPGCYVWDDYHRTDETMTWTEECSDGLAQGYGTLTSVRGNGKKPTKNTDRNTKEGENYAGSGSLWYGKKQGHWYEDWADGNEWDGPYVDGKRHGRWELRGEGFYVGKSKENGSRLVLSKRGEWDGPYVDGKRHGRWSLRSLASGSTVREEFYANGDLVLTIPKEGLLP